MAKINIHPSLVRFTDHQNQCDLQIDSVGTVVESLCLHFPLLKTTILNKYGEVTPYVNIYINGKHIAQCQPDVLLTQDDKVDILTALVGG